MDSSELSFPSMSGSRLLSESSLETNQEDLSISELSLDDAETTERPKRRLTEEKLQSDLQILRNLNAAFAHFNEALAATESTNQRVGEQLAQTEALLNKYINILSKSEQFSKLLFDEQWLGAEADEQILMQQRREAAEKAQREAEERALAQQRERERIEREEQERKDKERGEREKKEKLVSRGGVRGVRGTRGSTRGLRGTTTMGNTSTSTNTTTRGGLRKPTTNPRGIPRPKT